MSKETKTVLVIEDEDTLRLNLKNILIDHGYNVYLASDGLGAIKLLLDYPEISFIISDYKLPLLGGSYWMRFLKRFCPHIPIVVTSGFLKPNLSFDFPIFYKPYDYKEIIKAIESN